MKNFILTLWKKYFSKKNQDLGYSNQWSDGISEDDLGKYLDSYKGPQKQMERVLGVLKRHDAFYQAIKDPVGQLLLTDVIRSMDGLLEKIIRLEATDGEKMKYEAFRDIFIKWITMIAEQKKNIKKVREEYGLNTNDKYARPFTGGRSRSQRDTTRNVS